MPESMAAANLNGGREMQSCSQHANRRNLRPTKKENLMKTMFGAWKTTLGVAILATIFASLANAQCVDLSVSKRGATRLQHQSWTGKFSPGLFKLVADGDREASPYADRDHKDPIVGFWRVDLISEGNSGITDGTVLDAGFTQWHSDGTEILNSSGACYPKFLPWSMGESRTIHVQAQSLSVKLER